ncbi:hypothetical protein BXZ70DRAFT_894838 [Cristinia sonorae]|uniref:Uncharacterized protein n=1 Tax=Cristinia sonorae TaxID=1940300 RepID=A0A8K0UNY0_9AGAR|nr:hypothetical protein BXZ70DRAFT_894838 [Cristinia sonorae]
MSTQTSLPARTNDNDTPPSFTIVADPGTDAWRKPPTTDVLNAPTHNYAPHAHAPPGPFPLTSFSSARVTFSANWAQRYDQGGLLLVLTPKPGSSASVPGQGKPKWLKTGNEFYLGRRNVGTVGTDAWSDWSLVGIPDSKPEKITVEVRRESDENGKSLWVYWVDGEERVPVREVTWILAGEEEWDVTVGAYAARPASGEGVQGGLEVKFWDFFVERI